MYYITKKHLALCITLLSSVMYYRTSYTKKLHLDNLALIFGTDKSSSCHNYTEVYAHYFNTIRLEPLKLLEIGFYKGASARMWEKYFPNASLYFIDIDEKALATYGQDLGARCHLHKVDQSKSVELKQFAESVSANFDIIIDDGSHLMEHQITSFKTLFPFVKSKGIYIIEDLHTSYWKAYGSNGTLENPQASPNSTIRFFQALVDDVNYVGARVGCAGFKHCPDSLLQRLNYYQKYIKSIHFYSSMCVIIKR